jgi:hypothetical protein
MRTAAIVESKAAKSFFTSGLLGKHSAFNIKAAIALQNADKNKQP